MKNRDWVRVASAAALSATIVVTIYESSGLLARAKPSREREVTTARQRGESARATDRTLGRAEMALTDSAGKARANGTEPGTPEARVANQLEQVNGKLDAIVREKNNLQREKRDLEAQLFTLEDEFAQRDRYKYDLDRDDWKELAAQRRVRYRMPCLMPLDSSWKMSQTELDKLGLAPDDGETVAAAHQRSNGRVWATVRPLCMQVVGNGDVVDLLGAMSCIHLIEKVAGQGDVEAVMEARRQVAEVHAGMRQPSEAGQSQTPLFKALMTITSEARLFEGDLAQSFGPEEAKRIWQSMSCAATRD